jgi:NTP pyrophosphatase (non-canonical NTP hydrolase)
VSPTGRRSRRIIQGGSQAQKKRIETTSVTGTVDEEIADVLIFLCAIANRLEISIDDALRKKEALNETRTWK